MAAKKEQRVPYDLFDGDGNTYRILVKPAAVTALDMDHNLAYRVLESVKSKGQQPIGRWLPVGCSDSSFDSHVEESSWNPTDESGVADETFKSPVKKKSKKVLHVAELNTEGSLDIGSDEPVSFGEQAGSSRHISDIAESGESEEQPLDSASFAEPMAASSPATSSDSAARVARSSDESTGKWTVPATEALIEEMIEHRSRFQNPKQHQALWKDISDGLWLKNFDYGPLQCKKKKRSLDSYYCRVATRGGINADGKTVWIFYRSMHQFKTGEIVAAPIPDVPPAVMEETPPTPGPSTSHQPPLNASINAADSLGVITDREEENGEDLSDVIVEQDIDDAGGDLQEHHMDENENFVPPKDFVGATDRDWSEANTYLLISEYEERKDAFDRVKGKASYQRYGTLYKEIEIAMQKHGKTFTAVECAKRMKYLIRTFTDKYDKPRSGEGGCEWPYFDRISKLMGNSVSLEPPVVVAVGSSACVRRSDQVSASGRSVKARPLSTWNKQEEKVKKLTGYRGAIGDRQRTFHLQERKVVAEEKMAEEFAQMRALMTQRSADLKDGLQNLAAMRAFMARYRGANANDNGV